MILLLLISSFYFFVYLSDLIEGPGPARMTNAGTYVSVKIHKLLYMIKVLIR